MLNTHHPQLKTLVTMNRVYPEHTQTVQLDGHLDNQATGVTVTDTVHQTHRQSPGVVHLITRHSPPNPQTDPWSQPSDHLAQSTQPTNRPWSVHLITRHSPPNPQTDPWSCSFDHQTQSTQPTNRPWSCSFDHRHSPPNPQTDPWSCSFDHQTQSTQPTDP